MAQLLSKYLLFRFLAIIAVIVTILASGCSGDSQEQPNADVNLSSPTTDPQPETKVRTLQIRDHKQECIGITVFPCLYSKEPGEPDWGLLYDPIEGFDYTWGYNYELEVSVASVDNPLADGSSLRYTLMNVISKTPVPAQSSFVYSSRYAGEVITKKSATTYSLFNFESKEFICNPADCGTLDSLLAQQNAILFQFRHPAEPLGALILEQIVCSDNQTSFSDTCLPPMPIP